MIESTNAETADEPAHSEMTNPIDTTSPRAPLTMSRTVGSMISVTTFWEKKWLAVLINCSWIIGSVSGPNSGAMYARLPSIPSSSGGSDSAHQKAACADSEKIESSQLFDSVRFAMCQMWWRETGAGQS